MQFTFTNYLARQEIPLPSGVPIQITFNRAAAAKSLLQVADKNNANEALSYTEKIVPITNPELSCYFVESEKADMFYSKTKLYDVSINYFDYNIRRELLIDQVAEHKIKLFEGPLPQAIVFGLLDPDAFDGDIKKSTFKFKDHGLNKIDLQIDNQSVDRFPISMSGGPTTAYLDYLRSTNRYDNPFATGCLSYTNFVESNFLTFVDLKSEGITSGQLTLKLTFSQVLPDKTLLIFMPVFEKQLTFDQYMNVTVNNL